MNLLEHTLVGDSVSICDERLDPKTGKLKRSFEPQHPCCERKYWIKVVMLSSLLNALCA